MSGRTTHSKGGQIGWFRVLIACALLIGCVWFIWSNSMMSAEESGRQSQIVAEFLARVLGKALGERHSAVRYIQLNVRKIAHAVEFFSLGFVSAMMLIVLRRVTLNMFLHAVLLVLTVAVADEAIQIFTGRGAQVQDILLDFAGGMTGLILLTAAYTGLRRLTRR